MNLNFQRKPENMSDTQRVTRPDRPGDDLVLSYMALARSLARRFSHRPDEREDLEQVAMAALVAAARRFDPSRQVAFSTFATVSIVGELKRHFRDKAWGMRVPRSLQERHLAVRDASEQLSQTLGASPSVAQVADHLGVSQEQVLEAMEAGSNFWPASLGRPRPGDEDGPVLEPVIDDDSYERRLELRALIDELPNLSEEETAVIAGLYFRNESQRQVARDLGVSQMQVSRLHSATIRRLRTRLG